MLQELKTLLLAAKSQRLSENKGQRVCSQFSDHIEAFQVTEAIMVRCLNFSIIRALNQ